jgi:hypothetical protein
VDSRLEVASEASALLAQPVVSVVESEEAVALLLEWQEELEVLEALKLIL